MSNGIVVNGDGNSLLFSTETDNLSYQGKASFFRVYQPDCIDYTLFAPSTVLYNWPAAFFYEYRITLPAQVTSIMPFIYNQINKRVALINIRKLDSTTWEILAIACTNPNVSQPTIPTTQNIPTIYVFANYIDVSTTSGNGISVYDSTGKAVFTTNERHLLLRATYAGTTPFSNLQTNATANGPDFNQKYITSFAPLSPVGTISKPAIFFASTQTTRLQPRSTIFARIWELTAAYDFATKNLLLEWANIGQFFSDPPVSAQQSTNVSFFCLIADGANYD